jgi:putative PIN family toxin of toxin-antitoxin system
MKSGEKLRVVLDTNVILNALSSKLPYRVVLQNLLSGGYELCVTSEILLEYEEKITEFYSEPTATILLDAFATSSHVRKTEIYFRFNAITDLDDNKFLDCAFASNAHYLVSDDKDFRVLKNLGFPKIEWVTLDEFCKALALTL